MKVARAAGGCVMGRGAIAASLTHFQKTWKKNVLPHGVIPALVASLGEHGLQACSMSTYFIYGFFLCFLGLRQAIWSFHSWTSSIVDSIEKIKVVVRCQVMISSLDTKQRCPSASSENGFQAKHDLSVEVVR